jgi:Protein of unknown function (DUF559)
MKSAFKKWWVGTYVSPENPPGMVFVIQGHYEQHWSSKANRPAPSMEEFLDSEVARGALDPDERESYIPFIFRYSYIPMDSSYHMTLQPRFPNIKIEGKAIRPDIYFWIPSKPQVNVIVECDGFKYHSDKERFKTDRQRDRALKALGYDVWRFETCSLLTVPRYLSSVLVEAPSCGCGGNQKPDQPNHPLVLSVIRL